MKVALVLVALPALIAGCAFDSKIAVQFAPASSVVIRESFKAQQISHSVQGVTTRRAQVVRIDCSITIVYDINEATGSAVLAQRYLVHLRTRSLPRSTTYKLDCSDPLIVEIPAGASDVRAIATNASGQQAELPTRASVASIPLAFSKRLRPEARTQLAVVYWPPTLSAGDYEIELDFNLPEARAFREKVLYAASVTCGRSSYVQPILPPVAKMAAVPAFTIHSSSSATTVTLPHIAGANAAYAEARRMISCIP